MRKIFLIVLWISPFGWLTSKYECEGANELQNNSEIKWTLMPGGRQMVRIAILSGLEPTETGSADDVRFILWTRENSFEHEGELLNGFCLADYKNFKKKREIKLVVHGFGDTARDSILFPLIRDAFLASGDYNIIAVDWASLAAGPWYHVAARNTAIVAERIAAMIDHEVRSCATELDDFHLIGFSLGAHVVGITGQMVNSGRIPRITGLDPAQILYESVANNMKLDRSDADLVEVIHTSGGYLAFIEQIGHRDFFPNGGFWPQPGCDFDFVSICSHQRAYYYFSEAVKYGTGFRATLCGDWASYKTGLCKNNERIPMWCNYNASSSGKFFLDTNAQEPFSKD